MNETEDNNLKDNHLTDDNLKENEEIDLEAKTLEFVFRPEKIDSISSAATINEDEADDSRPEDEPQIPLDAKIVSQETETAAEELEEDPIFKELSEPKLPVLERENRARLQMQSPHRVFFYWSMKNNPYQTLSRALGGRTGSYTLVVKLVNQTQDREDIFPVEAEGSWWFDTDTGSVYNAEIGFYAPNRPFVRVLASNTIETPRKSPSPQRAETADWAVSAHQFARVLDVAGFKQDAFEVAFAGDDAETADRATQSAFSQLVGTEIEDSVSHDSSEIRYALLAIASGAEMESLRGQISRSLFQRMQQNAANLSAEKALGALEKNFGEMAEEFEETLPTVFGASRVNFPRRLKRKIFPKFSPLSSLRRAG